MILVTGATGTNGREIVRQLAALGLPVVAFVRDIEKARSFRGLCVRIAEGDLGKPETLDAALKGVDSALMLSANTLRQVEHEQSFIDAAKRAGVRHVVKFSALGADPHSPARIFRWHGTSEKALEASGLGWTHLRPGMFMQNLLGSEPSITAKGEFYGMLGDARIAMVDVRDVAAVAVKALTEHGHEGKIYTLTGPEALSQAEAATKLSEALGKTVRYVDLPPPEMKNGMIGAGLPEWLAEALIELFRQVVTPGNAAVTRTVTDVSGKPATTFEQFASEFAGAFRAA